ncbi:MAG: hypothetical protein ACRDIV_00190, partial [Ktedonobacteraceae bacterium]
GWEGAFKAARLLGAEKGVSHMVNVGNQDAGYGQSGLLLWPDFLIALSILNVEAIKLLASMI